MTKYHIIGDIHGYADKLEELLQHLGYQKKGDRYQQENTKVVFLGDFIDRGPHQRKLMDIVRPMVDNGNALAVMGNHEFNAICYHTSHPVTDAPLRDHSKKNFDQHEMFLRDYALNEADTVEVIEWFKTLPLYLEIEDEESCKVMFRAVHACWNQEIIDRTPQYLDNAHILAATEKGSREYNDIEILLKGVEVPLPEGVSFLDSSKTERYDTRVQWWSSSEGCTYRDVAIVPDGEKDKIPEITLPAKIDKYIYPDEAPPVFFGHYWMTGKPKVLRHNVACIDFSAGKGGSLVAYQWEAGVTSSDSLRNTNFTFAEKGENLIDESLQMQQLRRMILKNKIVRSRAWRGAEVIITVDPIPNHADTFPNDIVVVTGDEAFTESLSWLFFQLKSVMSPLIDFGNKYNFYGNLASTANTFIEKEADQQDCLLAVWEQAEATRLEWRQAEIEDNILRKRNS